MLVIARNGTGKINRRNLYIHGVLNFELSPSKPTSLEINSRLLSDSIHIIRGSRLDLLLSTGITRVNLIFLTRNIMGVRPVGVFLLLIFLTPVLTPTVMADWDDDNWLWNLIGPERLEHGDEFACHGYEGKDINSDNSVIESCKNYLSSHTNSSRWGAEPISFGVPEI